VFAGERRQAEASPSHCGGEVQSAWLPSSPEWGAWLGLDRPQYPKPLLTRFLVVEASVVADEARVARDAAFERFYRRYASHVYRYTLAVLRNPADAEDVTQTTFLNAYRAMQAGQYPRKPHHWLIKIAHNACRSRYLTRRRRLFEVPLDEAIEQLVVPPEEKPNVRAVLTALGRLPFNQRAALVMRELEGRSYREIAETLGVSVSAVEMLIFRARKSMRLRVGSVRALGAVQLPASIASYVEGGAAAGGLLGAGILGKVVAGLAAATVVAGTSIGSFSKADTRVALDPTEAAVQSTEPFIDPGPVTRARSAEGAPRQAPATTREAARPVAGTAAAEPGVSPISASRLTPAPQTNGSSDEGADDGGSGGPVDTATKALPAVPTPPAVTLPQVNPPPLPEVVTPALPVEPPPLPDPPKLP
jgi:RNA polymerase sigma factor (sigma-70 family)